jgi:hypothetical protein
MMKQLIFLCLLGGLGTAAVQAQTGVIGINTENPKGILHIDGAGNNPSTGNILPSEATDDVIVDAQGRIGIGHLSPEAQIDIHTETPGIRIDDGTAGAGKILYSDADGTGSWGLPPTEAWYAALYDADATTQPLPYTTTLGTRALSGYAGSLIVSGGGGSADATAGSITVPLQGRYRVMFSVYWQSNRTAPYLARAILRVNGADLRTFSNWGGETGANGVMPTFVRTLSLNAGDVLTLATDETGANYANYAQPVLFMVERLQ